MRNYILAWVIEFHVHIDEPGGGTVDFTAWAAGRDEKDLMVQVQKNVPQWEQDGAVTLSDFKGPIKAYWLLDKDTFIRLMQVIPDAFYLNATAPPAEQWIRNQVDDSPRDTGWSDGFGHRRQPSPSDRRGGAPKTGGTGPGKGPAAVQSLTVELYLGLLVLTYQFERKYTAAVAAADILKRLLAKKITPEQALAEAAKLPKTQ